MSSIKYMIDLINNSADCAAIWWIIGQISFELFSQIAVPLKELMCHERQQQQQR